VQGILRDLSMPATLNLRAILSNTVSTVFYFAPCVSFGSWPHDPKINPQLLGFLMEGQVSLDTVQFGLARTPEAGRQYQLGYVNGTRAALLSGTSFWPS